MKERMLDMKAEIMDGAAMRRAITRIAHEITERNRGARNVALVGIVRRGFPLAQRIAAEIGRIEGTEVPVGALDITFYRDDLTEMHPSPVLNNTNISFEIEGRDVVLVDDVIFTGRTVRAAIDGLFRLGRAHTVQLAVLVDRGLRELPFKPDYVGKNIPTSRAEVIRVRMQEVDGEDSVAILSLPRE